jgi:hypothetical protein
MKYIIKESRLNKAIYKYIDELFDGVYYVYGQNYDKGIVDKNILEFISDDYEDSGDYIFDYVKTEYYEDSDSEYLKNKYLNNSPVVTLNQKISMDLTSYFGSHWKPVFKQWLLDKFGLSVKTIQDTY